MTEDRRKNDERFIVLITQQFEKFENKLEKRDARLLIEIKAEMEAVGRRFQSDAIAKADLLANEAEKRSNSYTDTRLREIYRGDDIKNIHRAYDFADRGARKEAQWVNNFKDWLLKGTITTIIIVSIYFFYNFNQFSNDPLVKLVTSKAPLDNQPKESDKK